MATRIDEIAPAIYRISTYEPRTHLQFNQFLVNDDEPLLFHTGMRATFPVVRDAVATVIDPAKLRWISFSHFEPDECGSLNEWLALAPNAQALSSFVGVNVCLSDFAIRPARVMKDNEILSTGKRRLRFLSTPHVPHAWEALLLFEETTRTLFCSDLFSQNGDEGPLIKSGLVELARTSLVEFQAGPMANYLPYTPRTDPIIRRLAELRPNTLAIMHGASFTGDCEAALLQLAQLFKEILGGSN